MADTPRSVSERLRRSTVGRVVSSLVRRRRDASALRSSGLFDDDHYRMQAGDVRDPVMDYLRSGSGRGQEPHPVFDREHYLATNPTAARSVADPYVEFVRVGARRGKSPHPLFDSESYLEAVPEAASHPQGAFGHYFTSVDDVPAPLPADLRDLADGPLSRERYVEAVQAATRRYRSDPDHRDVPRSFREFDHRRGERFIAQARAYLATVDQPPLVSVIIPTKDRRGPVAEAIASVQAQTYPHWELIVVDDGGTDDTGSLVEGLAADDDRIRYVHQANTGVAGARNHGIRLSRGNYLAYLDSDNTWVPEFLGTMVAFLLREGLRAGYCASELRSEDRIEYRGRPLDVEVLRERNYIDCITLVQERSLVDEIGAFDEQLRRVVDWDLLIRLSEHTRLGYAPFVGTSYDVWDERGERITMTESVGYRYVVINKHRVRWEAAPTPVAGRTSVVLDSSLPLAELLASMKLLVSGSANETDLEIVVADTGYDDRDALMLRMAEELNPAVRVVRLVDCPSVPVGRNAAATLATGDVVIFCDGALLQRTDIRRIREAVGDGRRIVQPVVTDVGGAVVSAGLGLTNRGHVIRWGLDHPSDDPLLPTTVDAVEGRVMALDAVTLRQLRGFDPLFVHGHGDVDLCLRARPLNVSCKVDRGTVVSQSSGAPARSWSPAAVDRVEFQRRWAPLEEVQARSMPDCDIDALLPATGERGGLPARWRPLVTRTSGRRRWAIKTCVPSLSVAHTWGDWHFAQALRDALTDLGQEAVVDTVRSGQRSTTHLDDINIVLRGTQRLPANPSQTNYLWIISHPERVTRAELEDYDRVFVASLSFAERLREEWGYEHVEPLLQCTDPERFFPDRDDELHEPLLFVGNSRRVVRPVIADALDLGYEPAVYGSDWEMLPDGLVRGSYLPNEELRRHYSSAGVVLNDHWDDMRAYGILSNRLFDAVATGAVVVSDHVAGMEAVFSDRVVPYRGREDLRQAIETARSRAGGDNETAERIRREHSFAARASRLVETADELVPGIAPERAPVRAVVRATIEHTPEPSGAGAPRRPPVFVGGTGRSGTTIAGELIGASTPYALIPIEVRFHSDPNGLAEVVAGRCSVDAFVESMRSTWWPRRPNRKGPQGLHVLTSWLRFERLLERFRQAAEIDRGVAAASLIHELLDPVADEFGAAGWVEMTPPVIKVAPELAEILPTARFVHMARDGRDVASSVARRGWGPNTVEDALRWWADEMIEIHRSTSRVAPERVLHLRLEELVGPQRDDAFGRLAAFLDLDGDEPMQEFFDEQVASGKAHQGRWAQGMDVEQQRAIEELYDAQLQRLSDAGVTWEREVAST